MNKSTAIILAVIVLFVIFGCGSTDKSKILEKYSEGVAKIKLNDTLQRKLGSWIYEGKECYGLATIIDEEGNVSSLTEVKAVVLIIQNNKIKMKSLERISLAPRPGCPKMAIEKGDTWWEEEGDLFQTREEAIEFGKTIKLHKKSSIGLKFTVD